jgi:hypothetical protein
MREEHLVDEHIDLQELVDFAHGVQYVFQVLGVHGYDDSNEYSL